MPEPTATQRGNVQRSTQETRLKGPAVKLRPDISAPALRAWLRVAEQAATGRDPPWSRLAPMLLCWWFALLAPCALACRLALGRSVLGFWLRSPIYVGYRWVITVGDGSWVCSVCVGCSGRAVRARPCCALPPVPRYKILSLVNVRLSNVIRGAYTTVVTKIMKKCCPHTTTVTLAGV